MPITTAARSMTAARWQAVKEVLYGAMARVPAERSAFVAAACASDEALLNEVNSLLEGVEESDSAAAVIEAPRPHSALAVEVSDLLPWFVAAVGDRYMFRRELGGGGMSRVIHAYEPMLERDVVIKVVSPQQAFAASAERFAREVLFQARLQQANIVPVLIAGDAGGIAYYVMPYVDGETMRERMSSGACASVAEAVGILRDVAKALCYAHSHGVVHRDIKPENILHSGGTWVVTDFGIAKAISAAQLEVGAPSRGNATITPSGIAVGTPPYMAPEQAAGDPDVGPAADIYAFGLVAYELLAGQHPFAGRKSYAEMMTAQVLETPAPLSTHRPDLPADLHSLIMQCLLKDPAQRPGTGRELLGMLDALPASLGPTAPAAAEAVSPSVAVLPLANLSAEPDTEYFSDGIAAELLSALTRLPGLRVAARTSSFAFKGQSVDLQTIAGSLGVETLLEGSVRRSGNRVRIAVQLVRAVDGLTLWSERYDRDLADIFAVQEETAGSIARALERTLKASDRRPTIGDATMHRRSARPIGNPEAFELYLRGRHLLEQRADGMYDALHCFEQAARLAPDFPGTHAGISMAYTLFAIYYALRPRDAFPQARSAADRALAMDPENALAVVMRAHSALWFEWQFERAEALARRALHLAPGLYLAHDCLGFVLGARGRFEEAIAAMQRARQLDPLSENATHDLAWILMLAGRWEEAIGELQPALAKHPHSTELRRVYAFCLFYAGQRTDARAEFRRVLELNVDNRWGTLNLVQALAAIGETAEAHCLMNDIERRADQQPTSGVGMAVMHHWLGEDDAALTWLERALEERDYWLVMLPFDPSMLRLREHPRFKAVMRQIRGSAA